MKTSFVAGVNALSLLFVLSGCGGDDTSTTGAGTDDSTASSTDPTETSATATNPTDPSETTNPTDPSETTDGETTDGETTDGETTNGETTDAETTDAETTDAETTDGSSSTGTPNCVPIDFADIASEPLSGDSACEGVPTNGVIVDASGLQAHYDEYCETLQNCQFPAPACDDPPDVDFTDQRIAYVFGQDSGCSGVTQITEVLDCGDSVEVHYTVAGQGMCALIVYAWDAALIPGGADVVFIED